MNSVKNKNDNINTDTVTDININRKRLINSRNRYPDNHYSSSSPENFHNRMNRDEFEYNNNLQYQFNRHNNHYNVREDHYNYHMNDEIDLARN